MHDAPAAGLFLAAALAPKAARQRSERWLEAQPAGGDLIHRIDNHRGIRSSLVEIAADWGNDRPDLTVALTEYRAHGMNFPVPTPWDRA
ncbi:hypothetical protein [Muricoccus nepalensis]|uniref:hypothetical protein n=1 Tax=Muricoccus nepalensis TaxID=1854500 RepID=UPI00112CD881|nr:hypothetical protein [Roseomonas nepalensis]